MELGTIYFPPEDQQPAYILFLNDMRFSQVERYVPVARSSTIEPLQLLLATERVERYFDKDENGYAWSKCFRKGGPLEWFNSPEDGFGSIRQVTSIFDRVQQLIYEWEKIPNALTM